MSKVMTATPSSLLHELQQAETSCIKCGFCLPTCPTYRLTGSEAASPRGRIDLMQAVAYGELEAAEIFDQLDLCLGCLACETACPAGVEFGKLLETGRAVARVGATPSRLGAWLHYLGLHVLLTSPGLLWIIASLLRFYQVSGLQTVLRRRGLFKRWSPAMAAAEAAMPTIPATAARRGVPSETAPEGEVRDTVAMLTGCVMPEVLPQVNHATVRVLAANGYGVMAPPAQRCCGALQAHAGELEKARQLAKHNIAVFESTRASWVVVNSAGCGAMKKGSGHLLADDAAFVDRAQAFSQRVCDISEILATAPLRGTLRPLPMRVAYDDACHLLHGQRVREQPRILLRQVPGLELLDVPEGDWCCGSAGTYNLMHADMARALLDRKMEHMASIQPQLIVTGNPGCLLQLRQGVKRHQLDVEVMHPIEVLAQAYAPATPASSHD
jgi:glycolate oxidase iron-sulfur subunit